MRVRTLLALASLARAKVTPGHPIVIAHQGVAVAVYAPEGVFVSAHRADVDRVPTWSSDRRSALDLSLATKIRSVRHCAEILGLARKTTK